MARRAWVYVGKRAGKKPSPSEKPSPRDKSAITAACEAYIAEVLKPRFLPEIRPSEQFNYAVDIYGKWLGNKYRFITRYRSDGPHAISPEFDAPFARIDYIGRDCFNLSYHRHTGEWLCLSERLSLTEVFEALGSIPHFTPC